MDVLETAAAMGLTGHAGDDVLGTIEEDVVLSALTELAAGHPGLDDLFDEADARVRQARSAGLDRMDPTVCSPAGTQAQRSSCATALTCSMSS